MATGLQVCCGSWVQCQYVHLTGLRLGAAHWRAAWGRLGQTVAGVGNTVCVAGSVETQCVQKGHCTCAQLGKMSEEATACTVCPPRAHCLCQPLHTLHAVHCADIAFVKQTEHFTTEELQSTPCLICVQQQGGAYTSSAVKRYATGDLCNGQLTMSWRCVLSC